MNKIIFLTIIILLLTITGAQAQDLTLKDSSLTNNPADDSQAQMMNATKQMAEFNASFNLQYLALQEQIQLDTLSGTMTQKHQQAADALNNG